MKQLVDYPVVNYVLLDLLRNDLNKSQWTVENVDDLLGSVAAEALTREQRTPALLRLQNETSAAGILTRCFILGEPVSTVLLSQALPTLGVENAISLGLISDPIIGTNGELLTQAIVDLRPHSAILATDKDPSSFKSSEDEEENGHLHNWWVASDLSESQTGQPLHPEHVLGIGSATLSLLRMTIREQVGTALDLGTGCGIQALYLATHCEKVIATDISQRACGFTQFNAALNNIDNIEVRQGSLFEPVSGLHFDLITSNPPFVITPARVRENALMEYRDAGMDRDMLIAEVISNAPAYLKTGGTLQMLANWEIHGSDPANWRERVEKWLQDAADRCEPDGLKVWLVQRDVLDYCRYAEMWMRDSGGTLLGQEQWETNYRQWVDDFSDAGVENIGMGFLAMQRVNLNELSQDEENVKSSNLQVLSQYLPEGSFPDGPVVWSTLSNLSLPEHWKDMVLFRAADVREERHYVPGSTDPELIRLIQGAGMGRAQVVSSSVAALVGVSDGELTVGQVIQALGALTGTDPEEIEDQFKQGLPGLLQAGMVSVTS